MNINPRLPLFSEVGIIALVPDRWGPCWQARHHIAARLAKFFHVVWIDCPPTWQESVRWFVRRPKQSVPGALPENFSVHRASAWSPNPGRPLGLRNRLSRRRLEKAHQKLREHGCSRIVLYLWKPEFADSLELLDHDLSCYHIDDEYSFSPVEREIDRKELELIRKVDQVFIHSPAMMDKKGKLNPNTQLVPNGVDFQQYTVPAAEPEELKSIRKPRIGYAGNLKRMLDWDLLLELSRMHPEWAFVFVGRMLPHLEVQQIYKQLSERENVHILGPYPTDQVPSYVQHFDVCIMPYKLDDYTKYIYPLKLHEYLACGKPVVGSPIPALQAFREVVLLADDAPAWSAQLARALSSQENTLERREVRLAVAAAHDWNLLVETIAATLARRLGLAVPSSGAENVQYADRSRWSKELIRHNRMVDFALNKP